MKAVVFPEPDKLEVQDVPEPSIQADEVLIRPKAVGICRSDFDLLAGEYVLPLHWPIIPGHEYAGEVVEVGAAVTDFAPGDRVVGECAVDWEATCRSDGTGNLRCGSVGKHFGFTIDGAMAEYTKARASWLHKLPDNLTYAEGAMIEPFTVGYYALSHIGGVDAGDTVLILGAGMIGLAVLIAAVGRGSRAIVVDQQDHRLELAKNLGADAVIDTRNQDLLEASLELTQGLGADVTVEAVGADPLLSRLFDLTGEGGRVSITGLNFNENLQVPLYKIQAKDLKVWGNSGSPFVWPAAIRFLSRVKPALSRLRSHEFSLSDAKEAFATANDPGKAVKVHLVP